MHYTGQVYRPPLEAYTPLLEVTYGCSHNACAFCTMYHQTIFGISPLSDIESDILEIKENFSGNFDRIYLLNGDPFVLPTERLLEIADLIHKHLPNVKTITSYASFYNLKDKSVEDMIALRKAGYNELYFGVETGDPEVLDWINKGADLDDWCIKQSKDCPTQKSELGVNKGNTCCEGVTSVSHHRAHKGKGDDRCN